MKNKYFIGSLILLVLLICGILFKADSQIQHALPKFKVAVEVAGAVNEAHESQIVGAIKRELRMFGDVQIVGDDLYNGLWQYRIEIHLKGIKTFTSGIFTQYAFCTTFYHKVPLHRFDFHWQEFYKRHPVVYIPDKHIGLVGLNNIEKISTAVVADFDKGYLQPVRDFRARNQ